MAHSTRSVRDARHNRYESYTEPHVYDRVEYWQRKRDRWQEEAEAGRGASDAFASGGLFAGFGQRHSPPPAAPQQQQQHQPAVARGGRRSFGQHEQSGQAYEDQHAAAQLDRSSLRPPPLFPSIHGHRAGQPQPSAYSSSASSHFPAPAPSGQHSYMSGVHELHGGPSPHEQNAKREAQRVYQSTLQQQMREKEERKRREKSEAEERERREEEEARNYNPFGRGGGGAPMRDSGGHIIASRTQQLAQSLSPTNNSSNWSKAAATHSAQQQPSHNPSTSAQQQQQYPATVGGFAQPAGRGGRVGLRSDDSDTAARQQSEKQQWQHSLAQQIEEKANKKRREEEARRDEDRREEDRLKAERSRLDEEWKREREKEQQKQRMAQEEQDSKARKGKAEEGLTDYEREQAMKGRKIHQQHTPRSQQQQQVHREEERKELTVTHSAPQYAASAAPPASYAAMHTSSLSTAQPSSLAELEHDMDRLRADLRHESDMARERRAAQQRQQRGERGGDMREAGRARRRQHIAALDEDDDDTSIARFLNKQHNDWRPQSEQSPRWQQQDTDSWGALAIADAPMELGYELGGGGQLAGKSTFVPLPADYSSRAATPEARPRSAKRRSRHHQQQLADAALDISPPVTLPLSTPPPPPARHSVSLPADERPLPALAKQKSRPVEAAATTAEPEQELTEAQAVAESEEELYADEVFVVEEAPLDAEDEQQYEAEEEQLATETEQQSEEEEPQQYELHQPSEYSKVVSDVDLADDTLDSFVTDGDERDTAPPQKKNGRKKWSAIAVAQAAA